MNNTGGFLFLTVMETSESARTQITNWSSPNKNLQELNIYCNVSGAVPWVVTQTLRLAEGLGEFEIC